MKPADVKIGDEFIGPGPNDSSLYRVTDVGSRVVIAIKLDKDESWYDGPPYAVVEDVFDEYDLEACEPVKPELA